MRDERTEPKRCVVTPIGPAISLPPRTPDRVGAHAEPHAKLKNTCKGAGRRQANDESLQNPEFGIRLHDPDQQQRCLGGHKAVGIEGDGKFVLATPLLAEIPKDRKSTRLNSSHANISYAVFCLKKKKKKYTHFRDKKQNKNIQNSTTI